MVSPELTCYPSRLIDAVNMINLDVRREASTMTPFLRSNSASNTKGRPRLRLRTTPRLEELEHRELLSGYNFTRLDVPGGTYTAASGINNSGQIVGYYR